MEGEPRLRRATSGDAAAIAAIQVETWRVDGGSKRLPHGDVAALAIRYRKALRR